MLTGCKHGRVGILAEIAINIWVEIMIIGFQAFRIASAGSTHVIHKPIENLP
jgi:hypothetical protein